MKIPFELNQKILHKNGYTEKEYSGGNDFKKPMGKADFPRFHIERNGKEYDIHIDLKRRHGFINKWLFNGKENIVDDNYRIRQEVLILKLEVYDSILESMRQKIIDIRKNIKTY